MRANDIPELDVDLRLPPAERWAGLRAHAHAARALIASYNDDLGLGDVADSLLAYRDAYVDPQAAAEMAAIAQILEVPEVDVLLSNLYYDALKVVLGCTAFAVETPAGPLHGRNLDWGSENHLLSRHTLLINYRAGDDLRYRIVGWPGYVGALSGLRPGAFAITLNAVLSRDAAALHPPVTLLIRSVLAEEPSFDAAVARLRDAPIASDCLLLVTGTQRGEMAVIERAPTRAAVRHAEDGVLIVANAYHALPEAGAPTGARSSPLEATSAGRYARALALARERRPTTPREGLELLADPGVRMAMTMQSMVLRPSTGEVSICVPV